MNDIILYGAWMRGETAGSPFWGDKQNGGTGPARTIPDKLQEAWLDKDSVIGG